MTLPCSDLALHRGQWSRRAFLGAVADVGGRRRVPADAVRCQRCSRGRSVRPVGLFAAADYTVDFKDLIGRGLKDLGCDVRGRRVFLKPNMVEYESDTAINTHPLVVAGAALAFRAAGAASVTSAKGRATAATWNIWSPKPALRSPAREPDRASSI